MSEQVKTLAEHAAMVQKEIHDSGYLDALSGFCVLSTYTPAAEEIKERMAADAKFSEFVTHIWNESNEWEKTCNVSYIATSGHNRLDIDWVAMNIEIEWISLMRVLQLVFQPVDNA